MYFYEIFILLLCVGDKFFMFSNGKFLLHVLETFEVRGKKKKMSITSKKLVQTVHVIRYVSWCINLYIFNEIFKMSSLVILRILNVLIRFICVGVGDVNLKMYPSTFSCWNYFWIYFVFCGFYSRKHDCKFSLIMHICCQIWLQYCNSNLHASSNKLIFSWG